jgi:hypothetical protein
VSDTIQGIDRLVDSRVSRGKISVDHRDGQSHGAQEGDDDSLGEMHFNDGSDYEVEK